MSLMWVHSEISLLVSPCSHSVLRICARHYIEMITAPYQIPVTHVLALMTSLFHFLQGIDLDFVCNHVCPVCYRVMVYVFKHIC